MDNGQEEKATEKSELSLDILNHIHENTINIQENLVGKIKNDSTLKEAFEKLYAEMKLYKENFLHSATKPVILDLILLYDNLKRKYKKAEEEENSEIQKILKDNIEDVEDILYRRDVEVIVCSEQKLNKQLQRAVKVVSTEDSQKDGEVIEIVRDGFLWEDKVLRLQEVIIYKQAMEVATNDG